MLSLNAQAVVTSNLGVITQMPESNTIEAEPLISTLFEKTMSVNVTAPPSTSTPLQMFVTENIIEPDAAAPSDISVLATTDPLSVPVTADMTSPPPSIAPLNMSVAAEMAEPPTSAASNMSLQSSMTDLPDSAAALTVSLPADMTAPPPSIAPLNMSVPA
ncbi:unnamed protein product, partial [Rotaria sp. Silwood2]